MQNVPSPAAAGIKLKIKVGNYIPHLEIPNFPGFSNVLQAYTNLAQAVHFGQQIIDLPDKDTRVLERFMSFQLERALTGHWRMYYDDYFFQELYAPTQTWKYINFNWSVGQTKADFVINGPEELENVSFTGSPWGTRPSNAGAVGGPIGWSAIVDFKQGLPKGLYSLGCRFFSDPRWNDDKSTVFIRGQALDFTPNDYEGVEVQMPAFSSMLQVYMTPALSGFEHPVLKRPPPLRQPKNNSIFPRRHRRGEVGQHLEDNISVGPEPSAPSLYPEI